MLLFALCLQAKKPVKEDKPSASKRSSISKQRLMPEGDDSDDELQAFLAKYYKKDLLKKLMKDYNPAANAAGAYDPVS